MPSTTPGQAATGSTGLGGTSGGFIPGGIVNQNTPPVTGGVTPRLDSGPCVNLECQRHMCNGATTSISGTVYDPAGKNPIYNVAVYVPNEPLKPLKTGASCDTCSSLFSGTPVAAAVTDATGKFTMQKAPDGPNIPLVIQVGKWRKQITIPNVVMCQDNALPDKSLVLPKNHMEGDIPNIAISTGGADTLECLLRRVGIDASEYIPGPGTTGRIHIFAGSGGGMMMGGGLGGILGGIGGLHQVPNTSPAAPMSTASLWDKADDIMGYDIVLLSCEGAETMGMNQQVLHDYASAGGRVFASHFHYSWFNTPPYSNENLATWTPGANTIGPDPAGNINGKIVTTLASGQPFPKGMALQQWLGMVGALQNGLLPIQQARHNADVSAMNRPSQSWILADDNNQNPGATQYFSFDTPTDAGMTPDGPGYCGRVVFSDLHVGGASMDDFTKPVPQECLDRDLSPQEKALEFMLFDLSSCLTPNDKTPPPPTVQ